MANFYYVKNGGTATGDSGRVATTKSTGSFATKGVAAYYDSIYDVLPTRGAVPTTAITAGDYILASSAHAKNYSTASTVLDIPDGVIVMSVDDSNCDQYLAGATEAVTFANGDLTVSTDLITTNPGIWKGMTFKADDDIYIADGTETRDYYEDCTFEITGTGSAEKIIIAVDGAHKYFENCTFQFSNINNQAFSFGYGAKVVMNNCTINNTASSITRMFDNLGNGGLNLLVKNTTINGGAGSYLYKYALGASDQSSIVFERCKIAAGYTYINGVQYDMGINSYVNFTGCGAGDNDYFHQEYYRTTGTALYSTTVYRTNGATYDGSTGFSVEFQPSSSIRTYFRPLRIPIWNKDMDLSSVKTLTFYLGFTHTAAVPTINKDDIWIELEQNDSTSKALGLTSDSKPSDPLASGVPLNASTEDWTNLTGTDTDKREISINTTAVTSFIKGQVAAYLCVAYYDANLEIFCCPSPVVT